MVVGRWPDRGPARAHFSLLRLRLRHGGDGIQVSSALLWFRRLRTHSRASVPLHPCRALKATAGAHAKLIAAGGQADSYRAGFATVAQAGSEGSRMQRAAAGA